MHNGIRSGMDSGNSGSLQSSSGGDEEYDSRAAASAVGHHLIMANQHPPPPLFDPFSSYTQPLHQPKPNDLNNPNPSWSGSIPFRSDPEANSHLQTLLNPFAPSFQTPPPPPPPARSDTTTNPVRGGAATSTAARNPRKRSRASRRAPTTVLTTDTTNFRAMVQEFTGIPASPFNSPSFPRPSRLDNLLGSRSAGALDPASTHLHRPFAPGGPAPPFFLPSSATTSTTSASSSIHYHRLPYSNNNSLLLSINNNNNSNNNNNDNNNNDQSQNPLFNSLLQTNPAKFIFPASSAMPSKPAFDFQLDDIKTGSGLNAFGLGVGLGTHASSGLNDLPGLISSDQAAARNEREEDEDGDNPAKWRRNNGSHENEGDGYDEARMKPVNGGFEFSGPTSSGFNGEKVPENSPTARVGDQGMMESWIFSSE